MQLFTGSAHPALADALSKQLGVPLGKLMLKRFSSGECYVKFEESVRGKDVYILQAPGCNPDPDLIELFLLCQAAKLSFAKSVHIILPSFPYSRQDRVAEPREAISAKLIAHLLETSGANHVMTISLHSDQIQGFFSIPVDVLDARSIFVDYFRAKGLKDPVVVSTDVGGAKRSKKFADALGAKLAILHKTRSEHQKATVTDVVGDVEGKTCILYDDMIDTAGSLVSARQALLKRGANTEMYAAATHAFFSGKAEENLKEAGFSEVVVTDSMPSRLQIPGLTTLPIAPLLAEVINHIESGQSVTQIYKE